MRTGFFVVVRRASVMIIAVVCARIVQKFDHMELALVALIGL